MISPFFVKLDSFSKSITASKDLSIFIPVLRNLYNKALSSPPHPQKSLGYPLHLLKCSSLNDNTPPKKSGSGSSFELYLVPIFPKCIGFLGNSKYLFIIL